MSHQGRDNQIAVQVGATFESPLANGGDGLGQCERASQTRTAAEGVVTNGDKNIVSSLEGDSIGKDEFPLGPVVAPPIIVAVLAWIGGFNPMVGLVDDAVINRIARRVGDREVEMGFLSESAHAQGH